MLLFCRTFLLIYSSVKYKCKSSYCCELCAVTNAVFDISVGGMDTLKIEEMEKMLKEAQLEKARLIESRVRRSFTSFAVLEVDYPESILCEGWEFLQHSYR